MAQVKIDGRKRRRQFATLQEAKAWEADIKREVKKPPPTTTPTISFLELANSYLDYAVKFSPKTYSEKRTAFRRLLKAVGPDRTVQSYTRKEALDYLNGIFKKSSGYSTNKERKNLAAAWNFGVKFMEGFPSSNPFLAVPRFPEERQTRYVPPESDFRKVVDFAKGQNKTLLLTFLHTAGRRGEIYRLQWKDVDFSGQRIRLGTRKRNDGSLEYEWLPMTDELFNALLLHRQQAVNEWVFVQPSGRFQHKPYTENRGFPQDLCRRAGVKPFGCHAIRHLTASILANNNVPMIAIQQILRHKKLATTERYVRGLEPIRPHLQVLEGDLSSGPTNGPTKQIKKAYTFV
jgi:integrase